MFSEKAYAKLKNSREYHGFSRNCYIGFLCTYLIAAMLAAFAVVMFFPALNPLITAGVIAAGFIICIAFITHSLKKKPQVCTYGKIEKIQGRYALVNVDGEIFKGSSFENFLGNKSLDNYKVGDTVLIYSSVKKHGRPLFYHG